MAAQCQKPDQKTWGEALAPLQANIESITRLKEANRKDRNWFTHMSTISEGAPVVGWITVELKPAPYVKDIVDSTMFYGNRVIKEFKDKYELVTASIKTKLSGLKGTKARRMGESLYRDSRGSSQVHLGASYHWFSLEPQGTILPYLRNACSIHIQGSTVEQYLASGKAPAAGTAPPPPPPPPPPPALAAPPPAAAPAASGPAAVFAELNRGEEEQRSQRPSAVASTLACQFWGRGGIFEEQAVPEMLKTVIKDGKLVTTVVEHVG
ncbi:Signal recognition particle [Salix suchowensis]|nr:Signal recognition particle [Salix suchowensis]